MSSSSQRCPWVRRLFLFRQPRLKHETERKTNEITGTGFLSWGTIKIIVLGLLAFSFSTLDGMLFGKLMYKLSGGKINPLIGSGGGSAVPMATRVSCVGREENPNNYLLMHAMGPNVAGVIGSAVTAGFLLAVFG